MDKPTPAMKQYMEIKAKYPDCIVFFRMGDFYETFYEDAKKTSSVLDIALTRRGMKNSEQEIPLAGIPYHALDSYLPKMIKHGLKVAIVEQLEDPKFAKGIVKRDVTRVITPGTLIDEKLLTSSNNYIASLSIDKKVGLAFIDISTGEFIVTEIEDLEMALLELGKFRPGEVIVQSSLSVKIPYFSTVHDEFHFHYENAKNTLLRHFKIQTLDGFGLKHKELCVSAAGALVSYLHETQKTSLSHINSIKTYTNKDHLVLDSTSIDNLELISEKSSLFKVLNMTQTSMGARKLRRNLLSPLIDVQRINDRLNATEELISKHFILEELREYLKNVADIDRLISRINYGNSNPRDLAFLQGSLELVPEIKNLLSETQSSLLDSLSHFEDVSDIRELIDRSIRDDPPIFLDQGGFIKELYNEELDELRDISKNAKELIRNIEEKEREKTGIKSMKIRYNQVFGYYIEITKANEHLVPKEYIRKQTMVNSDRFITEELKVLEEKILTAEEKIISLEKALFLDIVEKIKNETVNIQKISERIATIDLLCSFARVSSSNRYVKPVISRTYRLNLKKSRHPIIEKISEFIPNDVCLDESTRMMIITGPNMAGKSVYMKQVALNVIMAQIGCFVPASVAEIGIVDKIFCRTGASDDISSGQSTFMVEMAQTAQILNGATEDSLIVLDEIGRGTSTYDGVAIAWAVAEYIAKSIKAKTLFATHYHVLNSMEKEVQGIKNFNIAVEEEENNIVFLRQIVPGGTDKSYGIHVANLAGMPKKVIERSRAIQFKLENDDEISEKIVIETKRSKQKDRVNDEIEETERMIKSRQLTLDEL